MSQYPSSEPPVWGALPAEQYLLVRIRDSWLLFTVSVKTTGQLTNELQHNWNYNSTETPQAQRQRLIRHFVRDLEEIPIEWDSLRVGDDDPRPLVKIPTEQEIQTILAPWRPQSLRFAAAKIWMAHPEDRIPWVRTYYDEDPDIRREHDEQFAAWKAEINDEEHFASNPLDTLEQALPWLVLEDESLLNVGRDWEAVLDTMPELIGPIMPDSTNGIYRVEPPGSMEDQLIKKGQARLREEALQLASREERIALAERSTNSLQFWNISTVVLIVDQDAFALKKLKVVFADARGYTIRYGFEDADEQWWSARTDGAAGGPIDGNAVWNEDTYQCGLGEAYRVDGVVGKDLYNIQDLL